MKKSRFDKTPEKRPAKRHSKLVTSLVTGALAVGLIGIAAIAFSGLLGKVSASPGKEPGEKGDKKYIATKEIVVDKATGKLRKPDAKELKELVESLTSLTKRPEKDLKSIPLRNGGEAVDLQGGFGGVVLARPKSDGTMETRCVFTFEEAAEFLGLVEDNS